MYLQHFEINDYPFRLTPDTDYLYMSPAHSRAKAYMDYAIFNRVGLVVITGEIGSGKTTLIKKILSELDEKKILVAKIFQTQLDDIQILQFILLEFGINPFNKKKVELLDLINKYLVERHKEGKQTLLIIDDAQNLTIRALKELVLLSGIETQKEKMLHIILVGQPELNVALETPDMEHLLQRVSLRYHVRPLTKNETFDYIKFRLKVAGGDSRKIFESDVMSSIYECSRGIPRLINTLCDNSMTIAYADDKKRIDKKLFDDVLLELQWNKDFSSNKCPSVNNINSEISKNNLNEKNILSSDFQNESRELSNITKQLTRIANALEKNNISSSAITKTLNPGTSGKSVAKKKGIVKKVNAK